MGNKPTVAIRANSKEQKQKWKTAVEESEEYDSLSHLIRRSVARELAGGNDPTQTSSGGGVDTQQLDNLTESVERIDARLGDVSDVVSRLETQSYSEGGLDNDTIVTVFSELPIGKEEALQSVDPSDNNQPLGPTVNQIAEDTDLTHGTVEVALEQLKNDMASVTFQGTSEGPCYWREE